MLRKLVTVRDALDDPGYFGDVFNGASLASWRALLIAMTGEELTDVERNCSPPSRGARASRWSRFLNSGGDWPSRGKDARYGRSYRIFGRLHRSSWRPGAGERGKVPLLAASTLQADQAFSFVSGVFSGSRNLRDLVEGSTSDTLALATGIDIEVRPASFRTIRGITCVAAICDEIAFWRSDDSANPDKEVLKALRPALATTGGLLAAFRVRTVKRRSSTTRSNVTTARRVTGAFLSPRRQRER